MLSFHEKSYVRQQDILVAQVTIAVNMATVVTHDELRAAREEIKNACRRFQCMCTVHQVLKGLTNEDERRRSRSRSRSPESRRQAKVFAYIFSNFELERILF